MIPRLSLCLLYLCVSPSHADSVASALVPILRVEREGKGNAEASAAWSELVSNATLDRIPDLTQAFEGANPLAANYLRGAIEAIVDRQTSEGHLLPYEALAGQLLDVRKSEMTRWTAFDLIQAHLPDTAARLVPGFLNDPNPRLRRLAVARLMEEAETARNAGDTLSSTLLSRQALSAARDVDQIRNLAAELQKQGEVVDLPRHFGFLMHWDVIGPFDNTGREGFHEIFPPEVEWQQDAAYAGKGTEVSWQNLVTTDAYGKVDLNLPFSMLKEATAYARTVFTADKEQDVQLRLGSKNAWKIWLNDEFLFGRDEYHRGQRIDQYVLPARFRAGPNVILVKCCQNEQTQDWTVQWEFQLRVCDANGAAVLAIDRPPTPQPQEARRRPAN